MPTRRSVLVGIAFVCALNSASTPAMAYDVALLIGAKFPRDNHDDLDAVQPEVGISGSYRPRSLPFSIVAYIEGSHSDRVDIVVPPFDDFVDGHIRRWTLESGMGVGKEWGGQGPRASLGGGWANGQIQSQERTDFWRGELYRYHGWGPWTGASITLPLKNRMRFGLTGRYSAVKAKRGPYETRSVYAHVAATLAWTSRQASH